MDSTTIADMPQLIHITDTHLYASPSQQLKGVNTQASLQAVLRLVRKQHPVADMLILGGDLAQDESTSAYQALACELRNMPVPQAYVPGNHDDPESMQQCLGMPPESYSMGKWQLLFLNSRAEGQVGGFLSDAALAALESRLQAGSGRYQLIVMHHHPVPIGSKWLDKIGLADSEAFWNIVDRYASVRGILFGHVHQEFDAMRGTVRLLSSPSTCIQFVPGSDTFELADQSPGYRWLTLLADGQIKTGVERVQGFRPTDLADNTEY